MGRVIRICNRKSTYTHSTGTSDNVQRQEPRRREFFDNDYYKRYISANGNHFTDALAVWASKRLKNVHGDAQHSWSVEDVKMASERLGLRKPEHLTWGDMAYSANYAYAMFFGESLKSEVEVIKHAFAEASSSNYSGMVFNRWLSDVMGQQIEVPWQNYV